MELAIEQAKLAQKSDEVPIGAVIVSRSNVVSSAHNISNDPTAHAKMLLIRQACKLLSTSVLCDADMYVCNIRTVPNVCSSYLLCKN
jgi:tRNA(Arg) A34 adenosine deaminase TadA